MPGMVPHTLLPSYGMGHGMERELSPHLRRSQSMPPGSYPPADPRWSPHAHAGRSDREHAARNAPPLLGWKTGRNDPTLMHNEVVKMRLGRDRSEMEPQQARPHAHPRPRPRPRPHPHPHPKPKPKPKPKPSQAAQFVERVQQQGRAAERLAEEQCRAEMARNNMGSVDEIVFGRDTDGSGAAESPAEKERVASYLVPGQRRAEPDRWRRHLLNPTPTPKPSLSQSLSLSQA